MKHLTQTILVSITSLWLVGCATNSGTMKAQGMGLGALFGGVLGAAVCDKENRTACTIGGAIAGAGAGYWVGNEVAKRKEKYATREKLINGETTQITQLASKIRATNRKLAGRIKYNRKAIKQLTSLKRLKKSQATILQKRYNEVSKLAEEAQTGLNTLDRELQVQQQLYNDSKQEIGRNSRALQNWQNKITQLQKERDQLNGNITTLLNMTQPV